MNRAWSILAVCTLIVAAVQAFAVLARIGHVAVLAWKTGWEFPMITAGTMMTTIFAALTAGSVAVACIARKKAQRFRSVATFSAWSLVAGGAVWTALIISPIVAIVSR